MCGGVDSQARTQRPEAAHPRGGVPGGGHCGGGGFGRFDHRDDHRVGTGIEDATDRRGIRRWQSHRGRNRNMLQPSQEECDVRVVEIAVLDVESDVVVARPSELFGADDGRPHYPTAPDVRLRRKRLLQPAGHAVIAIFTRSGAGLQAKSNADCTSSIPKVWVT